MLKATSTRANCRFGEYHGAAVIYGATAKEALANGELFTSRSSSECGVEWIAGNWVCPVHVFLPGAGCEREAAAETTVVAQLRGNARLPRLFNRQGRG